MSYEDNILIKYKDYINWDEMILSKYLSENIIIQLKDKLNWKLILKYQKLTEKIIQEAFYIIQENVNYLNEYNAYIFFKYYDCVISEKFSRMKI